MLEVLIFHTFGVYIGDTDSEVKQWGVCVCVRSIIGHGYF